MHADLDPWGFNEKGRTDSNDRVSRIDLVQLLEPDAACRVVIDEIGVIGDESELDLSEDGRAAHQAHKKKFTEDFVAAVQSSWGSLRQIVEATRAEAWETQKQWIKKRKVEIVEIGSRIDETPDVSNIGDLGSQWPISEQQAFQERDALTANIKEEPRHRYNNKNRPKCAPRRDRGQPLDLGLHGSPSTCDVVGYVENHASPAASPRPSARF